VSTSSPPSDSPPPPKLPFWTLNKIYWTLFAIPIAAWFAMDGAEIFFFDKDPEHPERAWFKLGVYLLLVNLVSLLVWREDKRRAQSNGWRVSEKTLVYLATLGGLPGALLSMRMYRHKTRSLWLQARLFGATAALAAFTFAVLPRSWSYANDARWGLSLFSLFWWNLSVAEGILRFHQWRPRDAAPYLLWLAASAALFVGATLGGLYVVGALTERGFSGWDYARAAIIGGGVLLSAFNEIWQSAKGLRGKLPGWDPIPPRAEGGLEK
jgi:uncharacterized membrane protein YsdA (DUF1294 family)